MGEKRMHWGMGMLLISSLLIVLSHLQAFAHCDTLDGPVVAAARQALQKGDITPVLKWVRQVEEPQIRKAFRKALTVRAKGPQARELADRYFFETLVRLHRAGEGAPYTGLKPGPVEPAVAAADQALASGKIDPLAKKISEALAKSIRQRFYQTLDAKKHAQESVAAGRKFVAAYVQFTHFVEKLHMMATGGAHHDETGAAGRKGDH